MSLPAVTIITTDNIICNIVDIKYGCLTGEWIITIEKPNDKPSECKTINESDVAID